MWPVVPTLSTRGPQPPLFLLTRNSEFRQQKAGFCCCFKDLSSPFLPQKMLKVSDFTFRKERRRSLILSVYFQCPSSET